MGIRLLIHNIGFLFSTFVVLFMAVWVLLKGKRSTAHITLVLAFISIAVFTFSHFVGVNVQDSELSRKILMFNLSVVFISLFLAHSVFAVLGILEEQRLPLFIFYVVSIGMTVFYILYPKSFLLTSVPKMYFPNYYVAGNFQWFMRLVSDIIVPVYFMWILVREYFRADKIMKNRIKYFFFALFVGYVVGSLAILLVYDIPVDPLLAGPFMVLFAIPFAYGVVYYELLDIKIMAKRAFIYALFVASGGFFLGGLNYINNYLSKEYSNLPVWFFSFLVSAIGVAASYFIFLRLRETDILKADFVRIIMHKFRQPLTYIKWSEEELKKSDMTQEQKESFATIRKASKKLTGLTNLLSFLGDIGGEKYLTDYVFLRLDNLILSVVKDYEEEFREKKIKLDTNISKNIVVLGNERQFILVLETLFDNSFSYSPNGSKIKIDLFSERQKAYITVSDEGVGVHSADMPYLFTKFFRGANAKKVVTEGIGIGLFTAKNIMERFGGSISAFSPGPGKGAIFTLVFPLADKTNKNDKLFTPQ